MSLSENTKVIVVKNGLPPYAEPMNCGDVIGPNSIFGDGATVPSLLRRLGKNDFSIADENFARLLYSRSSILWEKSEINNNYALPATSFLFGSASSSFDLSWLLVKHGLLEDWSSVMATQQKEGRGQMRRPWHSPLGNLYVSFKLPENNLFKKTAAAVIVAYILTEAFRDMGFDFYLKWPNDIVSKDLRKLGGVLLEERDGVLIAGFGFNISQIPALEDLRNKFSLKPASFSDLYPQENKYLSPFFLWQELVRRAILAYTSFVAGKDREEIFQNANKYLIIKDRPVLYIDDNLLSHKLMCCGFSPQGGLLIEYKNGQTAEIMSGSVVPDF